MPLIFFVFTEHGQANRFAVMPLLPGIRFCYEVRVVDKKVWHYLIEASTGLWFAKADSRPGLHIAAEAEVRKRGLARTQRQIKKVLMEQAKVLYAMTCRKPRRRKPRRRKPTTPK